MCLGVWVVDMLTARETTLLDLFSARTPYVIPAYQREYSWTDTETQKLFDDLWAWVFDQHGAGKSKPDVKSPYFLGSILSCHADDAGGEHVVDGHQRLVTLTILFAVLRDLEQDKERRRTLDDLIRRRGRSLLGQSAGWRLLTLPRDRDGFQRFIQKEGGTRKLTADSAPDTAPDAVRRMLHNAAELRQRLDKEGARRRRAFVTCVLTNAFVAKITVADEDAAFAMFEVINQRGQPLAPKHVIKARLMEALTRDSEEEREANALWSALEAQFPLVERGGDRDSIDVFERFLDAFARVHEPRPRGRNDRQARSLIQRVTSALDRLGPANALETALPQAAQAYAALAPRPARIATGDDELDQMCEYLSWWEDEEWSAAAIRILSCEAARDLKLTALAKLERYAAVLGLASEKKNRRLALYQKIVNAADDLDALTRVGGPLTPKRDLVSLAKDRVCEALPLDKLKRRAVLARVNALLDPGQRPPLSSRTGTIEHILPKAVINNVKVRALYPGWTRAQAKDAMETLGNLALMDEDDNAQAGTQGFSEKCTVYFPHDRPSPYALLEDLRLHGVSEWTPQTWRRRHDRLAKLVLTAWALDGVSMAREPAPAD